MFLRIVENQLGNVTVIKMNGHLVMGREAEELKERINELVEKKTTNIVVDIEEVTYIDSYGLGELVACLTTVKKGGGAMALAKPTEFVSDVLRATHLHSMFDIFESEEAARASLTNVDQGESEKGAE